MEHWHGIICYICIIENCTGKSAFIFIFASGDINILNNLGQHSELYLHATVILLLKWVYPVHMRMISATVCEVTDGRVV